MMKKAVQILCVILALALLTGCGGKRGAAEPSAAPVQAARSGRQVGERYEGHITLEGMEEAVQYEHIRSASVGIEIDYEFENFVRRSEPERECFVSNWDRPEDPQNYLELTYRAEDAGSVAAEIAAALSAEYELSRDDAFPLNYAGSCIRIDASANKGGLTMPDKLQTVYVIPAPDGCRVAVQHCEIESAEGLGVRFRNMLNTLEVITRTAESQS